MIENYMAILKRLALVKKIRLIDYYFAEFILRLEQQYRDKHQQPFDQNSQYALVTASCLVSHQESLGDVCIQLSEFSQKTLFESNSLEPIQNASDSSYSYKPLIALAETTWHRLLNTCSVIGLPNQQTPLVLSPDGRLYLAKYWHYEASLAQYLVTQSHLTIQQPLESINQYLDDLFPHEQSTNWQKIAAIIALKQSFCVISGGPGTGKTTTITKILALLIKQKLPETLRIALAAPTGKAAARLTESLLNAQQTLHLSAEIQRNLPDQCSSIHRLLGANFSTSGYRYHAGNRLHYDVVIIDEASMIDLSLMYHLTQALLPHTRLILLGDKDQLASVDSGSVLGNICSFHQPSYSASLTLLLNQYNNQPLVTSEPPNKPLSDNICILQKSYRFDQFSGIGELAKHIKQGDYQAVIALFDHKKYQDIQWYESIQDRLSSFVLEHYSGYLQTNDIQQALTLFNQSQVLCAVRKGRYGVEQINLYIEKVLSQQKLIHTDHRFYRGRPIMITKNDYHLQLFNGDIGIVYPDHSENNQLSVFFLGANNTLKKVLPQRLPAHETVFAMTIHKSQGSEFDHLLVLLPTQDNPILTRELIYTGITRAKLSCQLMAEKYMLKQAITRKVSRTSGLCNAIEQCAKDTDKSS